MYNYSMAQLLIYLTAGVFLIGGFIHWLIIFGVMTERSPLLLTTYFHSLAVLDLLVALGLLYKKRWALYLGLMIALTQIPAHVYMWYIDNYLAYGSGVGIETRIIDILLSIIYLGIFWYLRQSEFFQPETRNKSIEYIQR